MVFSSEQLYDQRCVPADYERSAAPPPHSLPIQPTPFVGRQQELADLLRRLQDPACRLLTVIGPGGIGKSRLAIQAAQAIVEQMSRPAMALYSAAGVRTARGGAASFADGVFYVQVQSVTTIGGLIAAIAEATGFRFYSDVPARQQLLNFLHEKQILLVLDHSEHLPDGSSLIAELLNRAPRLKLLVTSQKALHLPQEWLHPLAGMRVGPAADLLAPLGPVRQPDKGDGAFDAVQLFVQCALRTRADFKFEVEQEHVARICRLVDGMPLALELAAGWLTVLSCAQIADELEHSLDLLTAKPHQPNGRHPSLYAVLDQSWQILAGSEQDVLRRLSVFRGGFTQEAAKEIVGASLPILASLAEKALLGVMPGGRYQMHELLRQFVHSQMTTVSHQESAVRTRHADYYLRLFSQRAPLLLGKARRIALDEIGQEIENVQAAWSWAAQQRDYPALNQAVEPLYYFYQIHSRFQEGKEIFARAWTYLQEAANEDGDPRKAIVPVRVLARHAAFAYFLCEYEVAGRYLRQCLASAQRLDQPGEVAFALNFLGQLAVWQGDRATAREQLNRSLTLSLELGDKSSAASALEKLANLIHATFGEYGESKRLAEQSLAFSRGLGQPDWVAYALDTLGYVTFCLGEYIDAEAYYRESLALFETTGDEYGKAMALGGIGLVLWAMWGGKNVEANACFQKSLLICRTIGHQGQVCGRLAGLARIANDLGQYSEAQLYAEEGLAIARELGSPVYLSHILYCLGETAYGIGDLPGARRYLSEALKVTSEVGLLAYLAIALFHYATLLVKESETATEDPTVKRVEALRLLKLVQSHPATWHVYRERAARLARDLADGLPTDRLATEHEPGQTLEEVVRAINQGG